MSRQLATFTVGDASFGIDALRVQEVLRGQERTSVPLAGRSVAGFINLRGQVVLTIDLRTRLGLEAEAERSDPMMVVVQVDDEPIGLLVDGVGDVVDVEGLRLEVPPDTLPGSLRDMILGVHQLQDCLLLALDIDRVTAPEEPVDPTPRTH